MFRSKTGELKGKMVMAVETLIEDSSVSWTCKEGAYDWIGTNFTLNLAEAESMTILNFGYGIWKEANESMAHYSLK